LITLGIVGVVAAMTMPSLIEKHQKQVAVTKLKASYNIMSNAFLMAQSEHGDMSLWDWPKSGSQTQEAEKFIDKYLLPYLVNAKKLRSSSYDAMNLKYSFIDGHPGNPYAGGYFVQLNNGAVADFAFGGGINDTTGEQYLTNFYFHLDINGKARPNVYGKDMFYMRFVDKKRLTMFDSNLSNDRNELIQVCRHSLVQACGKLIIGDGWQIAPDYPW